MQECVEWITLIANVVLAMASVALFVATCFYAYYTRKMMLGSKDQTEVLRQQITALREQTTATGEQTTALREQRNVFIELTKTIRLIGLEIQQK